MSFLTFLVAAPLIVVWLIALIDIVQRPDLTTGQKWLRSIGVFVFPYLGVFAYLLIRQDVGVAELDEARESEDLVAELESLLARHANSELTPDQLTSAAHQAVHAATSPRST